VAGVEGAALRRLSFFCAYVWPPTTSLPLQGHKGPAMQDNSARTGSSRDESYVIRLPDGTERHFRKSKCDSFLIKEGYRLRRSFDVRQAQIGGSSATL
jgi:hypothetical protein